ncbi:hypothetical protein KKP62_10335 [Rhodococcus sp. GOMB7]|uniref:hypothetical protein n=1 Tax=Rhodococcus sp. GOMB7 TaxID=2839033 RepID=UPI000FFC02C1|nr:hypothetical protein [Rhodococcus sp. GOMB7]MBT9295360.1 hypothetical protein [Rhodococcus sp. GOMB7]
MTGVDVEYTKAEWIANRAGDLMDNSGCTLETAYEDATEHWDEYVDTEWLPALVAAVERVQALHTPDEFGMCEGCGDNEHGYAIVPHPCPTIRELEIK